MPPVKELRAQAAERRLLGKLETGIGLRPAASLMQMDYIAQSRVGTMMFDQLRQAIAQLDETAKVPDISEAGAYPRAWAIYERLRTRPPPAAAAEDYRRAEYSTHYNEFCRLRPEAIRLGLIKASDPFPPSIGDTPACVETMRVRVGDLAAQIHELRTATPEQRRIKDLELEMVRLKEKFGKAEHGEKL